MEMQPISTETEADRSYWKMALVAVFGVGSAIACSYAVRQFFGDVSAHNWPIALAAIVVFLVTFALEPVLIKGRGRLCGLVLLEALGLNAFFSWIDIRFWAAAMFATFCLLLWGARAVAREVDERVKVRIGKYTLPGVQAGLNALLVLVTLVYLGNAATTGALISREAFASLLSSADPLVQYFYPGVSLTDTFSVAAEKVVKNQLAGEPDAALLNAAQKAALVAQGVRVFKDQISIALGTEVQGGEKVNEILYEGAIEKLSGLAKSWQISIWAAVGMLIYLTLRTVTTVAIPFLLALVATVFELLLATKFAERFLEPRSREFIVMR